jgi:two-component system nitrogen regulation sensor histidine kinase NtrY
VLLSARSSVNTALQPSLDPTRPRTRLRHERRVQLLALAAALPGMILGLALLWTGSYTTRTQWTLTALVAFVALGFISAIGERVAFPLQTLANILGAMREGDFSMRARSARRDDALGDLLLEVNMMATTLREQRLGAMEAAALLRKVMDEIDVGVFAFDGGQRLRLVNRYGERLLAQPAERLIGRFAEELGVAECLEGEPVRTAEITFPGQAGRWGIRRSAFREQGRPHQLLVLADLSRALREEEREAWQRLIRVIGHELNNSLTPIKSLAGSLESMLRRDPPPPDWLADMRHGLAIIAARAESLGRFTQSYARLARLPGPVLAPLRLDELVARVARLEARIEVKVHPGPPVIVPGDADQLEQLFINLIRNAAEASLENSGRRADAGANDAQPGVQVRWTRGRRWAEVVIDDDGPGLSNTSNLFVPFFTTKAGGSGIGLVLSRQIAEAHGGSLTVANHRIGPGVEATVRLPL